MSFNRLFVVLLVTIISSISISRISAQENDRRRMAAFFDSDEDRSMMLNLVLRSYHGYGRPIFVINSDNEDHNAATTPKQDDKIKVSYFRLM